MSEMKQSQTMDELLRQEEQQDKIDLVQDKNQFEEMFEAEKKASHLKK